MRDPRSERNSAVSGKTMAGALELVPKGNRALFEVDIILALGISEILTFTQKYGGLDQF